MEINHMNKTGCCFPNARQCSAKSKRTGCRCRAPAEKSKSVCRFHGARAGAPKGRANGAYRTGEHTGEAIALRSTLRSVIRDAREYQQWVVTRIAA